MNLLAISILVFVRILAVMMTAPILGSCAVGLRTRLAIAAMLMMMAMPLVHVPAEISNQTPSGADWLPFIFSEAAIGITLGLGVTIMFSAASAAGAVIGQMTGLQLGETGGGESQSPVSRFFHIVSIAAFALIGGPALVVTALLDTFIQIPLTTTLANGPMVEIATELLQQSFMLTLRAVGPVMIALFVSNIVIGLISRTYPQMNLLGLGLSSNLVVMFMAVLLSLGGTVWLFVDDIESTIEFVQQGLHEATVKSPPTLSTPSALSTPSELTTPSMLSAPSMFSAPTEGLR